MEEQEEVTRKKDMGGVVREERQIKTEMGVEINTVGNVL